LQRRERGEAERSAAESRVEHSRQQSRAEQSRTKGREGKGKKKTGGGGKHIRSKSSKSRSTGASCFRTNSIDVDMT